MKGLADSVEEASDGDSVEVDIIYAQDKKTGETLIVHRGSLADSPHLKEYTGE